MNGIVSQIHRFSSQIHLRNISVIVHGYASLLHLPQTDNANKLNSSIQTENNLGFIKSTAENHKPIVGLSCSKCLLLQRSTQRNENGTVRHYSTSQQVDESSTNLFFPEFPTIEGIENLIVGIHNTTGVPWWTTIIGSAFLLRTLLPLPLTIYSMINSHRLQRLQPEIKDIAIELRKEVSRAKKQFGWTQKKAKGEFIKNMKGHLRTLYIRDNCHPMKDTATFWIRLPIWVSASYALRNMSVRASDPLLANHENCLSLTSEGIAWFTDLTLVDSTWILPVTMGLVTLLNVEIGKKHVAEVTTYRKVLTFALRGLSVAFIPISAYLPSGLVLYWVSSGVFSAIQTLYIDRSSTVQKFAASQQKTNTSSKSKPS